jgi:hypothetical protein
MRSGCRGKYRVAFITPEKIISCSRNTPESSTKNKILFLSGVPPEETISCIHAVGQDGLLILPPSMAARYGDV